MPKFFPLNVEVEEIAVGRVMRLLHKTSGVVKVGIDMGESKPKANGHAVPRKQFETSGKDFAFGLLYKHKMSANELRQHFADTGRSPNSIHSILHNAKVDGLLTLGKDGIYSLTKKARDRMRHKVKS